ncbi:MAG: hypothetical protein IKG22_00870 [Atopobiaceae bacterium]|nr:hypothetical protein [Atopobiaceae bacterium]
MLAEPCRTSAEGRVRRALQALALIILIVTFALLVAMAACETASLRPNIRCLVIVAGGAS